MRTWLFLAPVCGALALFAACGDDDAPTGATLVDSGIAFDTGAPSKDSSVTSDSATAKDGGGDAATSDAATDATPDAPPDAPTDAIADTGTDAGADAAASDANQGDVTDAAPPFFSDFEESPGTNVYGGGLNSGNWVASGVLATSHAGSQYFSSGNGNASGSFPGLSLKKNLGGRVENHAYTVSFFITTDEPNSAGMTLAGFTKLRIGGLAGTVVWNTTPTPTTEDVWVQWIGTYTPDAADVGGPFYFEATLDLPAMHTVAIDGPISVSP